MTLTQIKSAGLSTPIDLADTKQLRLGTGNDLKFFHDGNNSFIQDVGTGNLYIQSNTAGVYLQKVGGENMAEFLTDGAVRLFYDNSLRFRTDQTGIVAVGPSSTDATINMQANAASTNADLWKLKASASSSLFTLTNNASGSQETNLRALGNGAVELYHDNVKKFETVSDGFRAVNTGADAEIRALAPTGYNGRIELTADAGTNHEDNYRLAVNTDQIFRIYGKPSGTYTSYLEIHSDGKIRLPRDNQKLQIGASQDLEIYHDGSKSVIDSTTANLDIQSPGAINIKPADAAGITAFNGGAVELYHNANKKLETTANGIKVEGDDLEIYRYRSYNSDAATYQKIGTNNSAVDNNRVHQWRFGLTGNASSGSSFVFSNLRSQQSTYTEELRFHPDGGISFNGDTSSANALDDYEEGTCSNIGVTSAASSHVQKDSGTVYYTKIGRVVHLYGKFNASNLSTHFGGTHVQLHGFPFTSSSFGNSADILVAIWGSSFNWWNEGYPGISMENSTTTHGLYSHRTPAATGLGQYSGPDGNTCGNGNHQFNFDLIYFTDT